MLVLLVAHHQDGPLPRFKYIPAASAGQREIVLGPQLQYDTTMEVRLEKETPTEFTPNKVLGPAIMDYALGYVRWSVTDGKLFDTPCRILKMDGVTKGENRTKTKNITYGTQNTTTYWITQTGKLLRQSVHLIDPEEVKVAECVYWSDHIEVSVSDARGRRSFTVNPNIDLSLIDNQFKPMIADNKIILAYKEYYVFEPFSQAFIKYKATAAGTFHGSWLATKFEGMHVDIEGPKGTTSVLVSKEGDLVKAEMPDNRSLVLNNLPHSKDLLYQKTAGASGTGH